MIAYRYTWGEARLPLGAFIRSVVRLVDHSAVRLRGSHESSRAVCQTKVENSAHRRVPRHFLPITPGRSATQLRTGSLLPLFTCWNHSYAALERLGKEYIHSQCLIFTAHSLVLPWNENHINLILQVLIPTYHTLYHCELIKVPDLKEKHHIIRVSNSPHYRVIGL